MLQAAGLLEPLATLGFQITGFGCMSCVGNAGPLPKAITDTIATRGLTVCGALSSNRNFEGRLHPSVRATYLASPPLIIAMALAGSILVDLQNEPLGQDGDGRPVYLRDLWPSDIEIETLANRVVQPKIFSAQYEQPSNGGPGWQSLPCGIRPVFDWDPESQYLKPPPFLEDLGCRSGEIVNVRGARILLLLGDDITTDHISPGGTIPSDTSAGRYLTELGVAQADYNSYIARRGNHHVMGRASFANIRLQNEIVPDRAGGWTRHMPGGTVMTVYDAAMTYGSEAIPLVVVAGRNYGCGSSRDWAAKGTRLLGIRAVIAESFERIHRSNLVGMGVLPLQFESGVTRRTLALTGAEVIHLTGLDAGLKARMVITARIERPDGTWTDVPLTCRVDTPREVQWIEHGGILPYAARRMIQSMEAEDCSITC
jgi:aconitate hydratase